MCFCMLRMIRWQPGKGPCPPSIGSTASTASLPRHVLHAVAWPWAILDPAARQLLFGRHCITLVAVRRLLSTAARLLPQATEADKGCEFTWATYVAYVASTKNALTDAQRLALTLLPAYFECVEAQNALQYYESACILASVASTAAPTPPSEEDSSVADALATMASWRCVKFIYSFSIVCDLRETHVDYATLVCLSVAYFLV